MALAGKNMLVRRGGTPLEISAEPCSLVSGTTYRITDPARRTIDPLQAYGFFDGGVAIPQSNIVSIDHANGSVTLASSPGGNVTYEGAILPLITSIEVVPDLTSVDEVETTDLIDTTVIREDQSRIRSVAAGLQHKTVSLNGLTSGTALTTLRNLLGSATPTVLQVQYTTSATTNFNRQFCTLSELQAYGEYGDMVSVEMTWERTFYPKDNGLELTSIPLDSMLLWWKFDETSGDWLDSSSNNLDFGTPSFATQETDAVLSRDVLERVAIVDPAASSIQIDAALDTVTGNHDPDGLTIAYWHRQISRDDSDQPFFQVSMSEADTNVSGDVTRLFNLSSTDECVIRWGWITDGPGGNGYHQYLRCSWSTTPDCVFASLLSDTDWHHYAFTWDASTRTLAAYTDGVLTDSVVVDGSSTPNLGTVTPIKVEGNPNKESFRLHDAFIYYRALGADEVYALFQLTV